MITSRQSEQLQQRPPRLRNTHEVEKYHHMMASMPASMSMCRLPILTAKRRLNQRFQRILDNDIRKENNDNKRLWKELELRTVKAKRKEVVTSALLDWLHYHNNAQLLWA